MTATEDSFPTLDVLGPPPPIFKQPYDQSRALEELPGVTYALSLFLSSHMLETESWIEANNPNRDMLYFSSGSSLIQTVKALMSYEDEDLLGAINEAKYAVSIAQLHRKKATGIYGRLSSYITGHSQSQAGLKLLTPVELHAELVFAETTFEKALLGVVYSGDWFSFAREALAMRTAISTYRSLGKYLQSADTSHPDGKDPSLDEDFRSGVLLGNGMTSLILSLLPSRVLSVVELFGYKGDRTMALDLLAAAGGWDKDDPNQVEPPIGIKEEGIRRPICDVALLIFHLVMSALTSQGISLPFASRILTWNLRRYPNGIFFLLGAGRLSLSSALPTQAIENYKKAIRAQGQYRNLHFISFWEMGIAGISDWSLEVVPDGSEIIPGKPQTGVNGMEKDNPSDSESSEFQTPPTSPTNTPQEPNIEVKNVELKAPIPRRAKAKADANIPGATETPADRNDSGASSTPHKVKLGTGHNTDLSRCRGQLGLANWEVLSEEASWSPAVYTYARAACLLEIAGLKADRAKAKGGNGEKVEDDGKKELEEAETILQRVPGLQQKIAGKSIPIEKFVIRKSRKYSSYGNSLVLPLLEFGYFFQTIPHAPLENILGKFIPVVQERKQEIESRKEAKTKQNEDMSIKSGKGNKKAAATAMTTSQADVYWDDWCLVRFLEGVCWRYVAYPDPDAHPDSRKLPEDSLLKPPNPSEAAEMAEKAFLDVIENGKKIILDHHLVYHAHYELGRLRANSGDRTEARKHFDLVLSGKPLEVNTATRKGKYSLETSLIMRTSAAVEALEKEKKL